MRVCCGACKVCNRERESERGREGDRDGDRDRDREGHTDRDTYTNIRTMCMVCVYIYIHASQQFYSNGLGEKTWESRILGPRPAASSAALQDMLLLQAWPLRKSHADLKP